MSRTFTLAPTGPFDLATAAGFGFGPTEGAERPSERRMALAFTTDDLRHHAGVTLHQTADGLVHGALQGDAPDVEAVRRQVARVLSLDHYGEAWVAVGERDPVLGRLQREHGWMRPVLFH